MRLLAGGNALDLFPGRRIDDADAGIEGIEHKDRVGSMHRSGCKGHHRDQRTDKNEGLHKRFLLVTQRV